MQRLFLATFLLAATSCAGGGTSSTTPPVTPPGTPDVNSLTKLVLPVGELHCPTGGVQLTLNGGSVEYVCNGAVGPQGPAGPAGNPGSAGPSAPRMIVKTATGVVLGPLIEIFADPVASSVTFFNVSVGGWIQATYLDGKVHGAAYFLSSDCSGQAFATVPVVGTVVGTNNRLWKVSSTVPTTGPMRSWLSADQPSCYAGAISNSYPLFPATEVFDSRLPYAGPLVIAYE
jgi:hypothetical protein